MANVLTSVASSGEKDARLQTLPRRFSKNPDGGRPGRNKKILLIVAGGTMSRPRNLEELPMKLSQRGCVG